VEDSILTRSQVNAALRHRGAYPDEIAARIVDVSPWGRCSTLAIEANDEWLVGRSYVGQHSMATLYQPQHHSHKQHRRPPSSSRPEQPNNTDDTNPKLPHYSSGLDLTTFVAWVSPTFQQCRP